MRHLLTFVAFAALAACAVLLAACAGTPEPVAYDQICNQADGKLVQTVGYFAADSSVFCSNIGSSDVRCSLGFGAVPGQKAGFNADVAQGTGRNQVEPIPDDFTPEAIVFHAADDSEIHVGDKVSVTGKLSVAPNVCFIRVDTITKAQ
jgi:hypothetical protein